MLQIKSRAASQVTFDTDYNVPDAKPDVGRLIQKRVTFPWMKCVLAKERIIADKLARLESIKIKGKFDNDSLQSLSTEARQKLKKIDPETI